MHWTNICANSLTSCLYTGRIPHISTSTFGLVLLISTLRLLVLSWDARMPLQSHRTRVRREGRRLNACRAASCHVDFPTRIDVAQIEPTRAVSAVLAETVEMAGSSRNSRVRPKLKKKKKKGCKTHHLNLT